MNKSKAKNKYLNRPSRENLISYKRTKNKFNLNLNLKTGHNYDKQNFLAYCKLFLNQ